MKELLTYLFLGLVQGFTEPIPISSSGHIKIFKEILGADFFKDLNFEIIVNFGSLIAIVIYFRKDIFKLVGDFFLYIKTKSNKYAESFKYCWLIVIGTIPAGILGLLLKDIIENNLSSVKITGFALLITALFLFIIRNYKGHKNENEITYKDALLIGLFQAVALFPGISRSGATIVGSMFLGLKRDVAFKFSFMLFIPISIATMLLGTLDLLESNPSNSLMLYYFIGMLASLVMTYISTIWFNNIMKKGKLIYFVVYCLIAGSLTLLFL